MIRKIAIWYLIILAAFAWGVATMEAQVFPYGLIREAIDFVKGTESDDTTVGEKFANDFGIKPTRLMYDAPVVDTTGYVAVPVPGLKDRRDLPLMTLDPQAPEGYRLLFGVVDHENGFWGALLIGPDGGLVRSWLLNADDVQLTDTPATGRTMYGVAMLHDGSILFLIQDQSGTIVKTDFCGNRLWAIQNQFHHVITPTEDGGFWTFQGQEYDFDVIFRLIDATTGEGRKTFTLDDIRMANPATNIFDLQRVPNSKDAFHGNDIDPLPTALAGAFPQFEPGDLLVSFRTTNLIFVLDPDDLKVKWWRIGAWDRQHDPDWMPDGTISVFSNNFVSPLRYSSIVVIDPKTLDHRTTVVGDDYLLYTKINGEHETTPAGTTLITSSAQGRVFEIDREGRIVFDFLNFYDVEENTTLHMSKAFFLEESYFDGGKLPTCPPSQ